MVEFVWVFHGAQGKSTSGVFTSVEFAEQWIQKHKLTGMLSKYPVNTGAYDWAIENDLFEIKKESQKKPLFIQGFSSASLEHFHYENGEREND